MILARINWVVLPSVTFEIHALNKVVEWQNMFFYKLTKLLFKQWGLYIENWHTNNFHVVSD